jgi:hypothetical protein
MRYLRIVSGYGAGRAGKLITAHETPVFFPWGRDTEYRAEVSDRVRSVYTVCALDPLSP